MLVTSAFKDQEVIPAQYTCEGKDVSPPLKWERVPSAITYAIIVEDPDAPGGTFIHWVMYNIKMNEIPEGVEKKDKTSYGYQGVNDFNRVGYNGPCPPKGHGFHRYYFNVYALNTELSIKSGKKVTADDLRDMMEGHVIAVGRLMGKYKRD
ncbi:YbhB/YbcL family Raf kinase inhibitor-like protein [Metallosphaera tengchongensis]|uniref:YbhB/YbcL family Raf kinase inhibitor-like protein n=1 Tax=Metallosphaera tengchongensis TaxID=1532350 RepID=A0A6N0NTZ8_9CREN|nr:YbhB/YbcL family Raf kinase inhibitor-like protein [Metallosphaera tengchongensis]QKQ99606.1 YbhB/YbcL family Raf kinase inhibitor-like protein [Metallosphaera tengchongensis]